jgi:hypothetical protein
MCWGATLSELMQSDIEITVQKSADLPKQNDPEHYITRSGRISKPPTRLDL